MDNNYEHIVPWNGANDTGRDVRLKLRRNFERIAANFTELAKSDAEVQRWVDEIIKELANFLRKDRDDATQYLLKLLGGLHVGEAIDSMTAGKGTLISPDGRIQTDRIEVRHSMKVLELIFNRRSAMEGDFDFTASGTIERVVSLNDNTLDLYLRKRWDNDFTALQVNDIVYGMVNNLTSGTGEYYTSWMRVLSVDTAANKVNVIVYPDIEVPGGKNHPPAELMNIVHRGNPVNTERQGYWYISSNEKCICMLDGVTKPILEESNYSIIIGRLKHLSIFDNLPINYLQTYVYCRGIATQDLMQIDYKGVVAKAENNRAKWSAQEAIDKPYQNTLQSYDAVYHFGCKWMCLTTGTTQEPRFGCTGWAMIEGNPDFYIDIESSAGWFFDAEKFATVLTITGELYNQDVTSKILDTDITWTRDTGDIAEDKAWATAHANTGKVLNLTVDDLGPNYVYLTSCKFAATALLRDGQDAKKASMEVKVI